MKGASLVVHLDTGVSHLKGGSQGVEGLIIPSSTKGGDNKGGDAKGGDAKSGDAKSGADTRSGPEPKAAPKQRPQGQNPSGLY
jgi:hypothetical protein